MVGGLGEGGGIGRVDERREGRRIGEEEEGRGEERREGLG